MAHFWRVSRIPMKRAVIIASLFFIFPLTVCLAEMVSVKGNVVNVRSGPGTNHDALWKLYKGCPLKIIKKSGDWVMAVDFEGDIGWVHHSLLSKDRTVVVLSERGTVTHNKVNVRSGPGKMNKKLFLLSSGERVKVMGRQGNWIEIRTTEGKKGWIHKTLLKVSGQERVNLRKGPGTKYDIAFQAERGVILSLFERKGLWLKVRHRDGYEGWIREDLVWGIE
jgi:SH3-like domain-containing protein